jgi:hypothetical protein
MRHLVTAKTIAKIIHFLYVTVIALFLLDRLTNVEIKCQFIKSFVYLGVLIGTPIILLWNVFYLKSVRKKIFGMVLPALVLIPILIGGPLKILFSSGIWRTQTILYQNGHLSFYKIESQLQDIGAFGYHRRTVKVLYLTPLFMIISPVPQDIDKHVEWVKADKEVNELDLK